jgi:hypothetical protein
MTVVISGDSGIDKVQDASIVLADLASEVYVPPTSWTPSVEGSGTAGTVTYSARDAYYVKFGRLVYVTCYVSYSGGTGSGNLYVRGLPFTAISGTYSGLTIGQFEGISMTAGNIPLAYVEPNNTFVRFNQVPTGGGSTATVPYDAAGNFILSGFYITA